MKRCKEVKKKYYEKFGEYPETDGRFFDAPELFADELEQCIKTGVLYTEGIDEPKSIEDLFRGDF